MEKNILKGRQMRIMLLIAYLLSFVHVVYSTDPAPNLIIMGQDTLELRYYIPVHKYFKPFSRYRKKFNDQGGSNTACYSFRVLWKLQKDSLYLENIVGCNSVRYTIDNKCLTSLKNFEIPDHILEKIKTLKDQSFVTWRLLDIELNKVLSEEELKKCDKALFRSVSLISGVRNYLEFRPLVKKKYLSHNLFFKNFSGTFCLESGRKIDSMYINSHKAKEEDWYYTFDKGVISKIFKVGSIYHTRNFQGEIVELDGYSFIVPNNYSKAISSSLISEKIKKVFNKNDSTYEYLDSISSTLVFINKYKGVKTFDKYKRLTNQRALLKKKIKIFSKDFDFSTFKYLKINYKGRFDHYSRVPYICWIDGVNKLDNSSIKLISIANYYRGVSIILQSNNLNEAELEREFLNIIQSTGCDWIRKL